MKTAGYILILLGIFYVSEGIRGRTPVEAGADMRDILIALATADTKTAGEVFSRRTIPGSASSHFDAASEAINTRTGAPDMSAAGSAGASALSAIGGAGKRTVDDLVQLGKELRSKGFTVSENKALGDNPRPGAHMASGYHYKFDNSGAIDINWPNASEEKAKLDALVPIMRQKGFHVLWQVKGHYNHAHADISKRDV